VPQYHFECGEHGLFAVTCRLAEWSDTKPCPACTKPSEQVVLPQGEYGTLPVPIVVHVSATGRFRFPGAADAKAPRGFERVELKTISEVEKFERRVNHQLREEARDHQENEEKFFGKVKAELRGELRHAMKNMSPLGRDFARFVMALNDRKKRKPTEAGFYCDILHNDQSNREAHVDERTGWKRKYV
jgi:hypothetical protein